MSLQNLGTGLLTSAIDAGRSRGSKGEWLLFAGTLDLLTSLVP